MLKKIEEKITNQNANTLKYINFNNNNATIKKINKQINNDFGLVGPLTLSSVSKNVHAIRWANLREVFTVNTYVNRLEKEIIARGISQANKCSYCVDVHNASIASIGDQKTPIGINEKARKTIADTRINALTEWSLNTKKPDANIIKNPPFNKNEATEIIGTALVFHSTNRLVDIFLEDSPLPKFIANSIFKKLALNIASKTLFKGMVSKKVIAGDSLEFISSELHLNTPNWAKSVPLYAKTLIARNQLINSIEKEIIPEQIVRLFKTKVNDWKGEEMPLGRNWINEILSPVDITHTPIAKLIFLSAYTPHTITEKDISEFRQTNQSDKELVDICYWAIQIITDRISSWLIKPFNNH